MDSLAYITYYIDTGLIAYVSAEEIELASDLASEYATWPKDIGSRWLRNKCYRDSEGVYRLTDESFIEGEPGILSAV